MEAMPSRLKRGGISVEWDKNFPYEHKFAELLYEEFTFVKLHTIQIIVAFGFISFQFQKPISQGT